MEAVEDPGPPYELMDLRIVSEAVIQDHENMLRLLAASPMAPCKLKDIIEAIEQGDEQRVSRLLDADPDLLEEKGTESVRALPAAAEYGQLGVLRLLLERGAKINAPGKWGMAALHSAAENGHEEIVTFLLSKGAQADLKHEGHACATPLEDAFNGGHIGVMHVLMHHLGPRGLRVRQRMQWTPLMEAAGSGELGVVQALVEQMRKPRPGEMGLEEQDKRDRTALHWAALGGHAEVVDFLLSKGARSSIADSNYKTSLLYACERGHVGVVRVLLQYAWPEELQHTDGEGKTAVHWAMAGGYAEIAALVLSKDSRDYRVNHMDAFFWACGEGRLGFVQMLLQHGKGVELDEADGEGRTPLSWAAEKGHAEVVAFLLSNGAQASTRDEQGTTPLLLACENGHVGVVQVFEQHMVQQTLEERSRILGQALHRAAFEGREGVVGFLLGKGAPPSRRDRYGRTPLMMAFAKGGHVGVVHVLIQHLGPQRLDQRDEDGCTALHWAADGGHKGVRALLLAGADPTITDDEGRTPRALAEERHNQACMRMFDWWEGELERGYLLQRARCLQDAFTKHEDKPTAPLPAFLQDRAAAGQALPELEVIAGQQEEQAGGASGKRKASGGAASAQEDEGEERHEVLAYVTTQMNEQLFTELVQAFHGPEGDAEVAGGDPSEDEEDTVGEESDEEEDVDEDYYEEYSGSEGEDEVDWEA